MKTKQLSTLLIVSAFMLISATVSAQVLQFLPKNSSITINGTSNLHDWKSSTSQVKGQLVFANDNELKSLHVEIPVKSIKSGEKLMDSKTYETLNADKNPNIVFRMTDVVSAQRNGNDLNLTVSGNLTIAGQTKKVILKAKGKTNGAGVYNFNGDIQLKMTEFGMKPPTALLGTMKVGDQVRLQFDVSLQDNQRASAN